MKIINFHIFSNTRWEKKGTLLTYNFTNTGSDSLYEYLYKCIKKDILSGKIKTGEKLPSKRMFAKNLGISVITVENAYGQLIAEGYIYSQPKKGFFVSDLKITSPVENESGTDRHPVILTGGENAYLADFSSNQTETAVFPFSIWTRTMREIMSEKQEELMTNPPCGGIMELRENIARYLMDFRGMSVQREQIIVGAGTEYLYSLLIQLLGEKCVYGVENPGYHKVAKIYESMGVSYRYLDMDHAGILPSQLEEKKVQILHTSPSHHFPTGVVMPVSRRYELLGWAAGSSDRYIIEDDYDSELRLSGKPIPTLQSMDVSGKVIYMNTFTKTLSSTVRISYMVLPDSLADRFYRNLSFYSCTVSNFEQYTLSRFIQNGSFEKHINRLRNYYQMKRDKLLEAFHSHPIHKYISIYEEEAGVHFLMKIDTEKTEKEVMDAARAKGIRLNPVSGYYFGIPPEQEQIYVMNYSSVPLEKKEEIVSRIYEAVL